MAKLDQHVREKLKEWTAAGLISQEQADAIRAREPEEKPGLPWGILIFAGFGAVVLGLGVILLFAYNWDKMHKFAKLGVVFGAMAAAHGTGLRLRREEKWRGFSDSAQLLGTMLFGAGIWLVAQIYHISSHYPNAFFVWAAGALLLAWALPSVSQGLLASVLLSVWACTEVFSFENHMTLAPLLVLVGTGWLAWRMRSPVLLAASAVSFAVCAPAGFAFDGDSFFVVLLGVSVLFGSLSWLVDGELTFPSAQKILLVAGRALYFPLLFILTFHNAAKELLNDSWRGHGLRVWDWLPGCTLPLLALLLAGFAIRQAVAARRFATPGFRSRLAAPAFLLLVFLAFWCPINFSLDPAGDKLGAEVLAVIANVIFLYHVVASLWCGCRDARLGPVVGGSLLLAAWVFARFSDLFDSLLVRGVVFLAMGAALFAVAFLYHRRKTKPHLPPECEGKEI